MKAGGPICVSRLVFSGQRSRFNLKASVEFMSGGGSLVDCLSRTSHLFSSRVELQLFELTRELSLLHGFCRILLLGIVLTEPSDGAGCTLQIPPYVLLVSLPADDVVRLDTFLRTTFLTGFPADCAAEMPLDGFSGS